MSFISAGNTTTTTLVVNGDTTGNLVFNTGGANTTALTITNAQNATFAGTLTTASQGIAFASLPTGSVLQVVQGTYSTAVTSTTNTLADTGLTATITPKFSTSKILVMISHPIRVSGASCYGRFYINRAGTNIVQLWQAWGFLSAMSAQMSTSYLDSPATTSATIYKTQFANAGGSGTVYISPDGSTDLSTIVLMEIAA